MILTALSLALAGQAFDPSTYYKSYSRKEMRARIEACGFDDVKLVKNKAKRVVVRVKDVSATDEELICAAAEIDTTFYGNQFSPELAERFALIHARVARPRRIAEARTRFAKEPERGTPPERLEGETNVELAKRVETFCGPKAEGAIASQSGQLAISAQWMAAQSSTLEGIVEMSDTLGCLFQASVIAGLDFDAPNSASALLPM